MLSDHSAIESGGEMGEAAAKISMGESSTAPSRVIHLKSDTRTKGRATAPAVRGQAADPELVGLLDLVSRAAKQIAAKTDAAARLEERAASAEERLEAADRKLLELEGQLKAAIDIARLERERASDLHKRSTEMIETTKAMLDDASERLSAAEWRAEQAETSFAALREAVEAQFGPQ